MCGVLHTTKQFSDAVPGVLQFRSNLYLPADSIRPLQGKRSVPQDGPPPSLHPQFKSRLSSVRLSNQRFTEPTPQVALILLDWFMELQVPFTSG